MMNLTNLFERMSLCFVLAWCASAQAIETTDIETQRNRAKSEAAERERQQQAPRVELQPESSKTITTGSLPQEALCFPIKSILLEIPKQLLQATRQLGTSRSQMDGFRFAQEYLVRFQGRCIGRLGINFIVKGVTNQILNKGYSTTRVGVAEQDLSGGILKLTLIPGLIHQIRFADSASGKLNAFPSTAGDLLNLRDLEQGLEQMKRVTSQDVDMQIVPADKLGESDVIVSVKHGKPWKVVATLDDTGTKGTGKSQAGLSAGWDNLLDASDMLNIGISSDVDGNKAVKGTQGYSTSYSIPFGYWTLSFYGYESQYHQRVVGTNQSFMSSGKSQNAESKIAYLFFRDQTQKYSLQFRTGRRWSHSYIDDTEVLVQYRNTTFAEWALIHKHYLGDAQLDVTGAYRWGVPWFGAQSDKPNLSGNAPRLNYALETIDATLSVPVHVRTKTMTYIVTFRAQNTNTPLYASEWFSIGNRWTVRGFDGENSLGAEKGYFFRNQLDVPITGTAQTAYVGLDFGKVFGANVSNLLGNKLAGVAIGMRGGLAKGLSYDFFAGASLYKPQGYLTDEPAAGFNLMYQM